MSKLSLGNDVKENQKHLKDVILEVGYQHFQNCAGGHKSSTFPCNSWFDEECKIYLKLYKFAKEESERVMAWHQYKKIMRRKKRQYFQMQERKKKMLFKIQPCLAWRQLNGKKKGEFIKE